MLWSQVCICPGPSSSTRGLPDSHLPFRVEADSGGADAVAAPRTRGQPARSFFSHLMNCPDGCLRAILGLLTCGSLAKKNGFQICQGFFQCVFGLWPFLLKVIHYQYDPICGLSSEIYHNFLSVFSAAGLYIFFVIVLGQ